MLAHPGYADNYERFSNMSNEPPYTPASLQYSNKLEIACRTKRGLTQYGHRLSQWRRFTIEKYAYNP
jgi:hypothetical protein